MIPNHKNPKTLYQNNVLIDPMFENSTLIKGGGGMVPTRRPIYTLVDDGLVLVGDSACQVNPIHGGGIGAGMRAGIILGEVAKRAIARNDLSAWGLWHYNIRYLTNFGKRLAALEIFRRLLQSVSDEDMDFGFKKRILEAGDLMAANRGDGLSLGAIDKIRRFGRGVSRISLLRDLQKASGLMRKISKTYDAYPTSPSGLEGWNDSVLAIIEAAEFG